MAHFQGIVQGNRGEASRLGSRSSGMRVIARGWKIGARAFVYHENGKDYVTFTIDGGSGGAIHSRNVGTFSLSEDGKEIIRTQEGEI